MIGIKTYRVVIAIWCVCFGLVLTIHKVYSLWKIKKILCAELEEPDYSTDADTNHNNNHHTDTHQDSNTDTDNGHHTHNHTNTNANRPTSKL